MRPIYYLLLHHFLVKLHFKVFILFYSDILKDMEQKEKKSKTRENGRKKKEKEN